MKYVKSVYPKWIEDVKKLREMKKRPHGNVQRDGPDLHSTPNRKFHSHTDFEDLHIVLLQMVADITKIHQNILEAGWKTLRKTYVAIEKKWTIL